jgi:ABC-type bacteriocin/lantibiotic exporter with double-glycine peptidase domain
MTRLNNFFVINAFSQISRLFPPFVRNSLLVLIPLSFVISFAEVAGLMTILPVIRILLNPEVIVTNSILDWINKLIGSPDPVTFVTVIMAVIVFFNIIKTIVVYWANKYQVKTLYDVAHKLTLTQFQYYLFKPYQFQVLGSTGTALRNIIDIPFAFTGGILLSMVSSINELLVVSLLVAGITWYNPVLVGCLFVLIVPFFLLYGIKSRKVLAEISLDKDAGQEEMFRKCKQAIEGFREILIFNKFDYFLMPFSSSVRRFSQSAAKLQVLNTFYPRVVELLAVISLFVILLVGVWWKYDITLLASFLVAFAVAAFRMIPSVNKLIMYYNNIKSYNFVFAYFENHHLSNHKPLNDTKNINNEKVRALEFKNQVRLSNLTFAYDEKKILDSVDMIINQGDIIGVIGKSGSGKTTFMNLLLGLYQPNFGSILVDETELNESNFKNWHQTISLVPQNLVMIEGSILENIVFSPSPQNVNQELLANSLEMSGLQEFIDSLPLGINTLVSESALTISGGQRQRIAIARAFYHSNKFLLFDEATSSLDKESASIIIDSIEKLARQKSTIVMVTHQTELLRHCNKAYRIEKGKIVEIDRKEYYSGA